MDTAGDSFPLLSRWRAAAQAAVAVVLPTSCAGCGIPDVPLCGSCRRAISPRTVHAVGIGVPVCAGLVFDGVAARVLRACKEQGTTVLVRALAPALSAAAREVLASSSGQVVVVPVPTSPATMRRRGFRVVELLAVRAGLHPRRMLRVARRAADQRGLGVDARARNVSGTLRVAPRHLAAVAGRRVLLVDDVVTTGATLREAVRALEGAGATVMGAATVAATPRRSP